MEQCVDSEDVTAHEVYLRRINWNVILPNILDEFKNLIKEVHSQASNIEHHIKLYKADRCAELCAINTAAVDMAHSKSDEHTIDADPINASLTFSQDEQGFVAIVMQSRKNSEADHEPEQIVLGVYDSPTQVSKTAIKSALDDFGAYVRVLNSANKCKYRDRKRISNLAALSKNYTERNTAHGGQHTNWLWSVAFVTLIGLGVLAAARMGYLPVHIVL